MHRGRDEERTRCFHVLPRHANLPAPPCVQQSGSSLDAALMDSYGDAYQNCTFTVNCFITLACLIKSLAIGKIDSTPALLSSLEVGP